MNKITQFFKKKTNESFGYELLDEDIKSAREKQDDSEIQNLIEALDRSCVFADNTLKPDSGNIEKEIVLNDDNLENKTADKIYCDKPQQPVIDFPRDKEKRKFQAKWSSEFSWLEYEISTDS
jgi:hypothetical protein